MPVNKIVATLDAAIAGISDGASILVSGFGGAGAPLSLLNHISKLGLKDLTIISNNAGSGTDGLAALLAAGSVAKIICSYPRMPGSVVFDQLYEEGRIKLELVPQGSLTERIRAGGAGIGGFFTRTGADTMLTEGREHRIIDGADHVLEYPISADFALIQARYADRWGNLVYNKAARNYGPSMAMAGRETIAEVRGIAELGELDPEAIITPGIFVQRVVLSEAQ